MQIFWVAYRLCITNETPYYRKIDYTAAVTTANCNFVKGSRIEVKATAWLILLQLSSELGLNAQGNPSRNPELSYSNSYKQLRSYHVTTSTSASEKASYHKLTYQELSPGGQRHRQSEIHISLLSWHPSSVDPCLSMAPLH